MGEIAMKIQNDLQRHYLHLFSTFHILGMFRGITANDYVLNVDDVKQDVTGCKDQLLV